MGVAPLTPMPGVLVRELAPEDEPALQAVFAAAGDYLVAATGDQAFPGDVQSLYYVAPEGVSPEVKEILVIVRDGAVIGAIDAIPGHPGPDALAIGLFVLAPAHRRQGVGTAVARALLGTCRDRGIRRVSATTPVGWEPGARFLAALGFDLDNSDQPGFGSANRNIPGTESRVVRAYRSL
jgi:GNAT superfamily N-acetyltransferase